MSIKQVALCGVMGGAAVLLSACGGGGGGGNESGSSTVAPAVPVVASVSTVQGVDLSWPSVSGASLYKLSWTADGQSQTADVAASSGTISYRLLPGVHLIDWLSGQLQVRACAGTVCSNSASVSLTSLMLGSIGYLKASNTLASSHFGAATALSGDGLTLLVGAPEVSDEATGIYQGALKDRAVTGTSTDPNGAVYVQVRTASGNWAQQAYLKAPHIKDSSGFAEGGLAARFGASVAVNSDGSVIAIGAPSESSDATGIGGDQTSANLTDGGAVYVYTRDSSGVWSEPVYIKASTSRDNQLFGSSLSLSSDGNTLAVGAPGDDTTAADAGAVFVFKRNGVSWTEQSILRASNAAGDARFGSSLHLAADGSTLAVGAPGENSGARGINANPAVTGVTDNGAVYVFVAAGSNWSQQAYIKPSNTPLPADLVDGFAFGTAVALGNAGNTLVVGAPYADTDDPAQSYTSNTANLGAVFVFKRSGSTWTQASLLKSTATGDFANFGSSVALNTSATLLAVGAPGDATLSRGINGSTSVTGGIPENGGVFVFGLSGTGTGVLKSYVKASNTLQNSTGLQPGIRPDFGNALSLSGDGKALAVGAPGEYSNARGLHLGNDASASDRSQPGAGAVYLY